MSNPTRGAPSPVGPPRGRGHANGRGRGRGLGDVRGWAGGHGRGRGRGGGRGIVAGERGDEREQLRAVSYETKALIPSILARSRDSNLLKEGIIYRSPTAPPRLDQKFCPKFTGTTIQVFEADSFDAGIQLLSDSNNQSGSTVADVAVLNMASDFALGGSWLNGARAQEEALCRRSTLTASLKQSFYPTPSDAVIYSPAVIVFRNSLKDGHGLMDLSDTDTLPVISVISMAAPRRPGVVRGADSLLKFANPNDRSRAKEKMRIILRLSAWKRHRNVVLGALGCGAFRNPAEEVANCWAEVFSESEFRGGWWEKVVFAVIDETGLGKYGNGNVGIFFRKLDGIEV
ncbi:hypothetical protein EMCG_02524 [[Emmonsia] crescens]|uniref:Microbial-type PARG catalytic domain-containing protein n=1 Tax=[Emmonsia] crescens TaxID=73230 RepID=A0A0G2HXX0_9EURO|nr:hypothetical protein EMCG_02524 [Emmonsia crescens UAMH 3008]